MLLIPRVTKSKGNHLFVSSAPEMSPPSPCKSVSTRSPGACTHPIMCIMYSNTLTSSPGADQLHVRDILELPRVQPTPTCRCPLKISSHRHTQPCPAQYNLNLIMGIIQLTDDWPHKLCGSYPGRANTIIPPGCLPMWSNIKTRRHATSVREFFREILSNA